MLEKIAHRLTRKPKLVLAIALLLLIPSLIGYAATDINYDILTYLPSYLDSTIGERLLEDPFNNAATSMLIVENMPADYTNRLKQSIEDVPGVSSAIWISSSLGIQFPTTMLPDSMRDMFFSGDATMMLVQYESTGSSAETMKAIEDIRSLCNKNCFLAGFSVVVKDTRDLVDHELPMFVCLAVILALAAMSFTLESWLLPFSFITSIGLAVVYNMGTNIFLGEISYITKAIAAVLQLGVTMDYSIFLYNRYKEDRHLYEDKRDAMADAIKAAFLSLSGSSLTTIAGFLALCFMSLTLGKDIGIVMAKGVVLGVVTVIFVLPAIILVFDNIIEKYKHRSLMPDFERVNHFIINHSRILAVIFIVMFIPGIYAQTNAPVYYQLDRSLPQDMPSIVANTKLKDDFNMASSHFVVMSDELTSAEQRKMESEIDSVEGIESVISYNKLLSTAIPDFFIPNELKKMIKQDGMQMIMINSRYPNATDEVSDQINQLNDIVKSYDPNARLTGEAALTKDLIETAGVDFRVTNYLSMAAIFIIVAFVFKSLTVPIILVAAVKLAIFINQGIPYFTGTPIAFVTPTIVGCIQLGATVDYAILMTTRFREELQSGKDRKEAAIIAAKTSDASIITSALVLFCATLGVSTISSIEMIASICTLIARGAVISALICIFLLPALLYVFEPVFNKTSLSWRTAKPVKERKLKLHKLMGKSDSTESAKSEAIADVGSEAETVVCDDRTFEADAGEGTEVGDSGEGSDVNTGDYSERADSGEGSDVNTCESIETADSEKLADSEGLADSEDAAKSVKDVNELLNAVEV